MTKTKQMRKVWARRTIEAPTPEVWQLLIDTSTWPVWGPSVRGATVNQPELALGATGTVDTIAGVRLPFEITAFDAGCRWEWRVAGLAATDHVVRALDERRCEVAFGVPVIAAPYLAVCRVALQRIETLATERPGVTA